MKREEWVDSSVRADGRVHLELMRHHAVLAARSRLRPRAVAYRREADADDAEAERSSRVPSQIPDALVYSGYELY